MHPYEFTPTQLQQYDHDGFVIVRQLFDAEEVRLLEAVGQAKRGSQQFVMKDATGSESKLWLDTTRQRDIYNAYVNNPRLVRPMEQLLGGPVYQWHYKMMLKEPRVGGAWEWHQDYGYWYGDKCLFPRLASCMIGVNKASRENGCLQVLRGSHHLGRLNHGVTGGQAGADLERVAAASKRLELVYAELAPGDALYFHCNLLHRSDQNRSEHPRWAFICCYNAMDNVPYEGKGHGAPVAIVPWDDGDIKRVGREQLAALAHLMTTLPCGERMVRCLTGQPVDHVPYGAWLGWYPWGETVERWKQETGRPDLDVGRELEFEGAFTLPALEYGVWPHFETAVLEQTNTYIIARDWRGIVMKNRPDYGSMPEFLEHPVKCRADWDRLKAERLQIDDPTRVREDWPAFRARTAADGSAVQVGVFPWGLFGTPRDFLGAEAVLLAFCDDPEMVQDMMDHHTTLWLKLYEQVAAEVQIDHIHIWEDMAGRQGSLISPAMVERFMMPCYDRIAEFAKQHGVRVVSVDTDGDCAQLVPVMVNHGINMMFPFEVQAGCDILEYRRRYPTLGIMGGLDKRVLGGPRADVDREVARCAAMLRQGRYIPGFDHLIPPDATWDNFRYAAERIKALCYQT